MCVDAVAGRRIFEPPSLDASRGRKNHVEGPMLLDHGAALLRAQAINFGSARIEDAAKRSLEFHFGDVREMAVLRGAPFIEPDGVPGYAAGEQRCEGGEREHSCAYLYRRGVAQGCKLASHVPYRFRCSDGRM